MLSLFSLSSSSIMLTWSDTTTNVAGYLIERRLSTEATFTQIFDSTKRTDGLSPTALSFTDTNLRLAPTSTTHPFRELERQDQRVFQRYRRQDQGREDQRLQSADHTDHHRGASSDTLLGLLMSTIRVPRSPIEASILVL